MASASQGPGDTGTLHHGQGHPNKRLLRHAGSSLLKGVEIQTLPFGNPDMAIVLSGGDFRATWHVSLAPPAQDGPT